jgi:hypothetical protein
MGRYVIRRILIAIPTLIVISMFLYMILPWRQAIH